jgi:pilus assembly protein CpaC
LTGNLAQGTNGTTTQGLANILASLDDGQVLLAVNALRTLKLAKTLAEPNLVTLNGHPANFQAGGRFPVPVIGGFTGNGLQGVAFVPFGVQLQFTPYIVDRDRVRLSVNAEVSTRDEALGTNIGGGGVGSTQVSGLSTRNFTTTVELREGQTLAVAGLIQNNFGADTDRVPFWGDLPFIGSTGGFNRTSSGEQELVILISPELVHPLETCHTPNVPGSDVFEPGDLEFYLGNRLESRRTRDWRASVRTDYHRIRAGDKFCEDQFIIGPNGPTYGCCPVPGRGGACLDCPPPGVPLETLPPALPAHVTTLR